MSAPRVNFPYGSGGGGGGGVSGSGTPGTIPVWTGSGTTLTDSGLKDDGTSVFTNTRRVGVNTTSTLSTIQLQVGNASALGNYQGAQFGIMLPTGSGSWLELAENSTNGTSFRISKDSTTGVVFNSNGRALGFATSYGLTVAGSQMVLTTAGNVGIGTPTPTDRLRVNGGGLAITGNVTGNTQTASTIVVDNIGGVTRLFSIGPDASTRGSYTFYTSFSGATPTSIAGVNITSSGGVQATGTSGTALAFGSTGTSKAGIALPTSPNHAMRFYAGSAGTLVGEFDQNLNFSFNSGYGSSAVAYGCRAWVNFDSTATSNLTGTYSQSGTTVTVTVAAHGYSGGERVYVTITSGTAVTGSYVVASVISSSQFTYTAGTSLTTSGNITLNRNNIRTSGGVSSVADISTGIFAVNFSSPMPDVNYSAIGVKQNVATNSAVSLYDCFTAVGAAPGRTVYQCGWQCIENAAAADSPNVNLAFFR